jgi:hypothetical protein
MRCRCFGKECQAEHTYQNKKPMLQDSKPPRIKSLSCWVEIQMVITNTNPFYHIIQKTLEPFKGYQSLILPVPW